MPTGHIPILQIKTKDGKWLPVNAIGGQVASKVLYNNAYPTVKQALDYLFENGTGGSGTGSSTTAEKVAYTNENLEDVTTVKEALDGTVDALLTYNNMFEYMGNELGQKVSLSDITPEAIGAKAVTTKVDTGTSLSMNDNTEYRLSNVTTLELYAPYKKTQYECWFSLTFANSGPVTVTFPAGMKYIGSAPDFNNGESWEMSIKDGVVIAQKIGDGT